MGGVPNVFSNPQSTLLQQQQSFFQAFQVCIPCPTMMTCTMNVVCTEMWKALYSTLLGS